MNIQILREGKEITKILNKKTGEILEPKFNSFRSYEDYINAGVRSIEPMTAQAEENDETLRELYSRPDYITEEKIDGTRGIIHLGKNSNRVFSRRISKKTGWYNENTDSLPHLRDWVCTELEGTIIDGEFVIPNRPFKDVSSTLNCNWDEAIARQVDLGFVTLKAFDILYYKGVNIKKMPLWKRKNYLHEAVGLLQNKYIRLLDYFSNTIHVPLDDNIIESFKEDIIDIEARFPSLYLKILESAEMIERDAVMVLNSKAYYEYVVFKGGEGVILKSEDSIYEHKRSKAFIKVKKFDTWDCVIVDYGEPTREYEGNTPLKDWIYWYNEESGECIEDVKGYNLSASFPITKFFAKRWIGTVKYGVVVTPEEVEEWEKTTKEKAILHVIDKVTYLEVGETSGMTEEVRKMFSESKEEYIGSVIELKAHEIISKTGRLRHPRYLRLREDKEGDRCTLKDHMRK